MEKKFILFPMSLRAQTWHQTRTSRSNSILSLHFDDINNELSSFHIFTTTCFSEAFSIIISVDTKIHSSRKIEIHERFPILEVQEST